METTVMTTSFNASVTMSMPEVGNGSRFVDLQPAYKIALQSVVIIFIWIMSIPTNILVCIVIYRSRRVQSTTNYFVVSMAISDLILTLLCVPHVASRIMANRWVLGSVMCRLVRFFQTFAPTATIFVLVSISIDRFYAIIYPLSFKITRGTAKHLICACWILAFISSVFSIYFFETFTYSDESGRLCCPTYIPNRNLGSVVYGALVVTLTFVLPSVFVIVVYSRIFRYVWTAGAGHRRVRRTTNPVARNKVKMLKMLIIVTAVTLLCASPHYIVQICYTFSSLDLIHPAIFITTFVLLFMTTILKPIIYMFCNTNFRRGCREVFCMSNMKCYRSHTYAITTASIIGKKNHVGVMPTENGHRAALHSPSYAFNRTVITEKGAWPVSASISTTYI